MRSILIYGMIYAFLVGVVLIYIGTKNGMIRQLQLKNTELETEIINLRAKNPAYQSSSIVDRVTFVRINQLTEILDQVLANKFLRDFLAQKLKEYNLPGSDNPEELLESLRETRRRLAPYFKESEKSQPSIKTREE